MSHLLVPGGAGGWQRHDVQRPEDSPEPCLEPGPQLRPGERQQAERQLQPGRDDPRSTPVPQGPGRLHVRLHVGEGGPEEVQETPEDDGRRQQGLAEDSLLPQHLFGGGGGNDGQPSHHPEGLPDRQRLGQQRAHQEAEK